MNLYELLLSIILPFAIILFMIRTIRDTTIKMSGKMGQQIVKIAEKTGNTAVGIGAGAALGATAFAGRATIGRAVGGLSESQNLKNMAASDSALKRFIGNSLLMTGEKAKSSSFDIRNTGAGNQLSKRLGSVTGGQINLETRVLSSKVDGKARSIDNIVESKSKKKEAEMRARIKRMNMTDDQAKAYWEKRRAAYDKKYGLEADGTSKVGGIHKEEWKKEMKRAAEQKGRNLNKKELEDLKIKFQEDFDKKYGKRPPTYTNGKDANKAIRDAYLKRRKDPDGWKMAGNIVRGKIEAGAPGYESAERTAERTAAEKLIKEFEKKDKNDSRSKTKEQNIAFAEEKLKEINETLKKLLETHKDALAKEKARLGRELTEKEKHELVISEETAKRRAEHAELVDTVKDMASNLKKKGASATKTEKDALLNKRIEQEKKDREIKEIEKLIENKGRHEKTVGSGKEEEKS